MGDPGTGVVDVTLEPGDNAVCEYTNKQMPRLTIVKNAVDPDPPIDPQKFTFTPTGLTPSGNFDLGNNEQKVFANVSPTASFSVTEASVTDWTLTSLECTGVGSEAVTIDKANGQISSPGLTYGDDVVCTYVNTKDPAKAYLFVLKNTDPADATATFDFTASGPNRIPPDLDVAFPLAGWGLRRLRGGPGDSPGRDYIVTEAAKAGWKLTELDCVVSTNPAAIIPGDLLTRSVSVPLVAGEIAVCVFENQKLGTPDRRQGH